MTDQRSPEAIAYRRLYKTARWQRLRSQVLADQPLCVWCREMGRIKAAAVVDHIKAHCGNEALFFDRANLQPLCKAHHDSTAQSRDRTGMTKGSDINGWPK